MTGRATPATGRRRVAWIAASLLASLIVSCAGLAALSAIFFPTTDAIRIVNRTDHEVTDVRLLARAGFPDEHEIAMFPRIAPNASATADHTGVGAFSVIYTDSKGRWIGRRAAWFDMDDISGREPIEVAIERGLVGNARAQPFQ